MLLNISPVAIPKSVSHEGLLITGYLSPSIVDYMGKKILINMPFIGKNTKSLFLQLAKRILSVLFHIVRNNNRNRHVLHVAPLLNPLTVDEFQRAVCNCFAAMIPAASMII